jgi:hypothetical protein
LHERSGMDHTLHDLLIQQDNIVSRLQALEHMSLDAIRHNLRGKWRILLPGIYLAATGAPAPRQRLRAALLYGGSSAQLADSTALLAYGVRYLPQDATIRLLLPAAARRVNRDGVEVRRTHRLPAPRTIQGLPYCPPERALVEFAARVGDRRVATAVIADAVQRKIAAPNITNAEVLHITGRGARIARLAVADIVAGARSAPEADFVSICGRSKILPSPLLNALLRLPCGRKVSPDALWLDAGLVHETNGRAPHADEDPFEDMQSRHDAMTTAGLTLLHNAPRQLYRESDRILGQVETCYLRNAGRGLPPGVTLLRSHPDVPLVGL